MRSKGIISVFQSVFVVFCLLICLPDCKAAERCAQPVGKIVSIQGGGQVQQTGVSGWQDAAMDTLLCPGDMLRIAANGRAAVVLANETVIRIDQKSTLTFPKRSEDNSSIIELLQGVLHIFSHRPRSLNVVTPFVNGVVEGTEFLVRVDSDSSVITVFEGMVVAVNQYGELRLSSNTSIRAKKGEAPVYTTVVKPRGAVEWTLYYPAVINQTGTGIDGRIAELIQQAASYLNVGRVEEAKILLTKVLQIDSTSSEAYALLSIIETARNNRQEALKLALKALEPDPKSAAGALSLSYARQALFDLPSALATLRQASLDNPDNVLIKARLAELLVSVGDLDRATKVAMEAVNINPDIGLSQTVLGFVYLSRIETDEALTAFTRAIELNSASPLARMGLGLAKIRQGMLAEGRADIEVAAALDPGNALIRSYLGKAYFEEKRDSLARRQYEIAKKLDPTDPTPWFYDALRKQSLNRPVEALHDLQKSIELNDNRAVYRSRLLLDNDLASRSAGLGRIYTDLGFEQLARVEGLKSIQSDPTNYSAHRFLADTYGALPRHEIARVSELLQSQLLQPLNVTPVQPQLAESDLKILEGAGPSSASFNEFNPLFLGDDISLLAGGAVGSNDTLGDEVVVSGIEGGVSYSFGQFHYETDGIRQNNDQENDIYNGFFQTFISPKTSLLAEIRHREKEYGDLYLQFDPENFDGGIRQSEEIDDIRFGVRHDFQPNSSLLATAIIGTADGHAGNNSGFSSSGDITVEKENRMAEIQHSYNSGRIKVQTGAGYLKIEETEEIILTYPVDMLIETKKKTKHTNFYSYTQIDLPYNLKTTVGLSADILDSSLKDREELNPKVGLTWQPLDTTVVSLAAFRTVNRNIINGQTIEPTFVGNFNQFYDDFPDSTAETYGIGINHSFSSNLHGGIQFFHRDLEVPFTKINPFAPPEPEDDEWDEDMASAYVYWSPANWVTLGFDYYYENYSHNEFEGPKNIRYLTTHRLSPRLQFFHKCGLTTEIQASYVAQEGQFGSRFTGFTEDSDQFWIVDLSVSYKLPKRFGIVKIAAKNLFDEQFSFLDTDPANPRFLPEQQIIASVTVAF